MWNRNAPDGLPGHQNAIDGQTANHWRTRLAKDHSSIIGSGATGNLPNMLAQLSERVTSMHVDPAVVTFFDRELADAFALAEQLPPAKAERALDAALFAGHPLGESTPIAEQRKLSSDQFDEWFYRAWTPDGAVLVVVGELDAEATLAEVRRWFGRWERSPRPFAPLPPPPPSAARSAVVVTHQPGATQARVHLAGLRQGLGPASQVQQKRELARHLVQDLEAARCAAMAGLHVHGQQQRVVVGLLCAQPRHVLGRFVILHL